MGGRPLSPEQIDAVLAAARREDVRFVMAALYDELDAAIAAYQPECGNRGACCRFREYGHSLYVTTLEGAYFVACHASTEGGLTLRVSDAVCPFRVDGRCVARQGRPIGCRIFYCEKELHYWQGPLTERFLARLKALHVELGVPYVYAEWSEMLQALRM